MSGLADTAVTDINYRPHAFAFIGKSHCVQITNRARPPVECSLEPAVADQIPLSL